MTHTPHSHMQTILSCIQSSIHSFLHSFMPLLSHCLACLITRSLIHHLFPHHFVYCSVHSFNHLCSCMHSFTHSFVDSCMHSFIHLRIDSFIPRLSGQPGLRSPEYLLPILAVSLTCKRELQRTVQYTCRQTHTHLTSVLKPSAMVGRFTDVNGVVY